MKSVSFLVCMAAAISLSNLVSIAESRSVDDAWETVNLAVNMHLGKDGIKKDEKKAEALASKLRGKMLGEFYIKLANEYRSGNFMNIPKAIKFSKKALNYEPRNTFFLNRYFELAGYGELEILAAEMPG